MQTKLTGLLPLILCHFALANECNYYASESGPVVADTCGAESHDIVLFYACSGENELTELAYHDGGDGCVPGNLAGSPLTPLEGVCSLGDNCDLYRVRYDLWSDNCCGCSNQQFGGYAMVVYTINEIITSGGSYRCSGTVRYSNIDETGFTVTEYSEDGCKGQETVTTVAPGCQRTGPFSSSFITISLMSEATPTTCESDGRECNWRRDGVGCMSCRPFYDRVMGPNGLYECMRTDAPSQDEIDYACGGGCGSDNCVYDPNPNCEVQKSWGCQKCKEGYYRRDNDHLCVPCSLIPNCDHCNFDDKEWNGCDRCGAGYRVQWDFLFGYNRCQQK